MPFSPTQVFGSTETSPKSGGLSPDVVLGKPKRQTSGGLSPDIVLGKTNGITPETPEEGNPYGKAFGSGVNQTMANVFRLPALAYATQRIPRNLMLKMMGRQQERPPEWLLNNPIAKYFDENAKNLSPEELDNPVEGIKAHLAKGDYGSAARNLALQVIANAPNQMLLIGGTLAGMPIATLALAGGLQGANVLAEKQAQGVDPLSASTNALTQGTIEAAMERVGTMGLLKHWTTDLAKTYGRATTKEVIKHVGKAIASSALGEGFEEFGTQIGQDFSDYVHGDKKSMQGTFERAFNAAAVGALSGGTMTAPTAAIAGYKSSKVKEFSDTLDAFTQEKNQKAEEAKTSWTKVTKPVLKQEDIVVPFNKIAGSKIVTTTLDGTTETPNIVGEFTGDQSVRAKVQANKLFSEENIVDNTTGKKMQFAALNPTLQNIIMGNILAATEKNLPFNFKEFMRDLRARPTIYVSGVDKKSSLDAQAGINPRSEVFFSTHLKNMPLEDIAAFAVENAIPLTNFRFVQTHIERGANLTEPVKNSFIMEYQKKANLKKNVPTVETPVAPTEGLQDQELVLTPIEPEGPPVEELKKVTEPEQGPEEGEFGTSYIGDENGLPIDAIEIPLDKGQKIKLTDLFASKEEKLSKEKERESFVKSMTKEPQKVPPQAPESTNVPEEPSAPAQPEIVNPLAVEALKGAIPAQVSPQLSEYKLVLESMVDAVKLKWTKQMIQDQIDELWSQLYSKDGKGGLIKQFINSRNKLIDYKSQIAQLKAKLNVGDTELFDNLNENMIEFNYQKKQLEIDPSYLKNFTDKKTPELLLNVIDKANWHMGVNEKGKKNKLSPNRLKARIDKICKLLGLEFDPQKETVKAKDDSLIKKIFYENNKVVKVVPESLGSIQKGIDKRTIDVKDLIITYYEDELETIKEKMSAEDQIFIKGKSPAKIIEMVNELDRTGKIELSDKQRKEQSKEYRKLYEGEDYLNDVPQMMEEDPDVAEAVNEGTLTHEPGNNEFIGLTVNPANPYAIKGKDQKTGEEITVELKGPYRVMSFVDGKAKSSIDMNAEEYRILDGHDLLITADQFHNMLIENEKINKRNEEIKKRNEEEGTNIPLEEKPFKLDYINTAMGGMIPEARAHYNKQKAMDQDGLTAAGKVTEPWDYKRRIAARVFLECMRWTNSTEAVMSIMQHHINPQKTQKFFGSVPKLKSLPDDVIEHLYKQKTSVDLFAAQAHDQASVVDNVIVQTVKRDNPEMKRNEEQTKVTYINQLNQSANCEFYCAENDSVNRARTRVGEQHAHEPGLKGNNEEALSFLERAEYMVQAFNIDEQWMRSTYAIPDNMRVEDYLLAVRPEDFFYKMLAHPNVCKDKTLQELLRWSKATIETPMLNRMMETGLLNKADMPDNIANGFSNRVWKYSDTQEIGSMVASRRSGGPLQSTAVAMAKYRTYEEYLKATGPWQYEKHPMAPLESQRGKGAGLVPMDDYVLSLQQYVLDSLLTIDQQEQLKWFNKIEIADGINAVEYEFDVAKKAAAEGMTPNAWLTKYGFIQDKNAPGLALWYKGSFEDPYVHVSLYNLIHTMYGSGNSSLIQSANKANEVLTMLKRWKTINPFDTNLIYMAPVLLSGNYKVYKSLIRQSFLTARHLFTPGAQMLRGEYQQSPVDATNMENLPLFIKHGFTAGLRFEQSLRSIFNIDEMGKFAHNKDTVDIIRDFILTFGGTNSSIFNNLISKTLYEVCNQEYLNNLKKGITAEEAASDAVAFVNDASMMPHSAIYGKSGPIWALLFFSRNLISAPIRLMTGAIYGASEAPGIKGTAASEAIKKAYKYKTGPISQFVNPLLHGEKSSAQLDRMWGKYANHLMKAIAAKIIINWMIQYACQSLRGGSDEDKDMFKNPPGLKLSIWTGARSVDNPSETFYIEPQYLREVQLLYGLSERPVETLKNKMNVGVSEITNALVYMMSKGVPPPIVRNSKGEPIGGFILDTMDKVKSYGPPLGFEKEENINQPILNKADLFGISLKRGGRREKGVSGEESGELKKQAKTYDYLKERAFREIEQNPEKTKEIAKKYELPASTIISWKKNQRFPFRDMYKRNKRAIEFFNRQQNKS